MSCGSPRFRRGWLRGSSARRSAGAVLRRRGVENGGRARRKRRIGRKNSGLQREPWGSVLDPGNRVFKPEKTPVLSTCEMFGIVRMAGRDAVNESGVAIWG